MTMKRENSVLLTLFIYTLLILLPLRAGAATQDEKHNYYDKWRNVSSEKLMSRALDVIRAGGSMDSALIFYNVVYSRYVEDVDDIEKAKIASDALNDMGYLMTFYYYDFGRAYSYLSQALDISQQIGYEQNLPYIYVNIGNMLGTQRSYVNPSKIGDAVAYYRKGFYTAAKLKDWSIMMVNLENMLGMSYGLDIHVPINSIPSDVAYFKKLKIPANTPMLRYTRCELEIYESMRHGRYDAAAGLCEKLTTMVDPGPDSLRFIIKSYVGRSCCLAALGRYQEALDVLNSQLPVARKNGIKDLESELYQYMMSVSKIMGNRQLYEHYEYLYLKSKDDMLFGSHKVAFLEQTRLMHMLSKANEEVRANVRRQHYIATAAVMALILVIVIAVFTIVVVRKNRRLRERNHSLYLQVQNAVKEEEKYKNSSLDDKRRTEIVGKIEAVLADKELLCSEDMSLKRLADLTATPYKLVSQSINEHWQKNFSQLLAEYRIHEACRRMQDRDRYGSYSIEGIGASVGFHTRSNFVTTFKRITGLTPSEYISEIK